MIAVSLYASPPIAVTLLAIIIRLLHKFSFAVDTLFFDNKKNNAKDMVGWLSMMKLFGLKHQLNTKVNVRKLNSSTALDQLIINHSNSYVQLFAFSIVIHFNIERGECQCITDHIAIRNFINNQSLHMDQCCTLLRSNSPMEVYTYLIKENQI